MRNRIQILSFLTGLLMIIALLQPGFALADDDDDWDEVDSALPGEVDDDFDDDDFDDDDFDDDDFDDDDFDDDDLDDDDDDDDWDDSLDRAVPNEAILKLIPGVDPESFASDHGAAILNLVPEQNLVLLQLHPEMDNQTELNELTLDERVEWSELNFTSQAPEGRPRYFFTSTVSQGGIVDAPALPASLAYTPDATCVDGSGQVVAVLDTGVDSNHPMLENNISEGGWNTLENTADTSDVGDQIDNDSDGSIDELVGHGTHVAGSVVMVAPGAQIMPYKVLNSDGVGSTFSVSAGIYMAVDDEADVINLSLGSTHDSLAIRMAVEYAVANDVPVVAAAGNSNQYTPTEYPAAIDSVVSVGAVNAAGDKSSYSNFHETIDISAPGDNVASAHPGGRYLDASGTSMAAPLVSGTFVLMMEQNPNATTAEIEMQVEVASSPLNLTDPLLEGIMGAGILNISAAVDCGTVGTPEVPQAGSARLTSMN